MKTVISLTKFFELDSWRALRFGILGRSDLEEARKKCAQRFAPFFAELESLSEGDALA